MHRALQWRYTGIHWGTWILIRALPKINLAYSIWICMVNWKGREKILPTETESAWLLLSYQIDLISVHKGLENITCRIWHIINLYTCSYGYMKGLISYLPGVAVAYGCTHLLHCSTYKYNWSLIWQLIQLFNISTTFWFPVRRSSCHWADYLSIQPLINIKMNIRTQLKLLIIMFILYSF